MKQGGRIFGIVGENISYSLSPRIYNDLFHKYKIDATYSIFDLRLARLREFVGGVRLMPITGFNVTTPHKIAIAEYIDHFDKIASITKSVNMVLNKKGALYGYNTDFAGIKSSCEDALGYNPQKGNVVMFGSGGAATTTFYYLTACKVEHLTVVHRSKKSMRRFDNFVRLLPRVINYNSILVNGRLENMVDHDLCINCTPAPITTLMDRKALANTERILELRYTDFEPIKPNHISGKYMLAIQAVENFRLITGIEVTLRSVFKIIEEALK